jgi:Cys-rich four helix bundle protein (predicted Tat secretion target)
MRNKLVIDSGLKVATTQTVDNGNSGEIFSRRAVLSGMGAMGAMLATGASLAQETHEHSHAHHAPQNTDLLSAAEDCSNSAQKCLAHCLVSFTEGDTSLGDCARSVHEMLPICDALAIQVASNSAYVGSQAKVCRQACADCEAACRKHEKEHVECRECAEACARIVAVIDNMQT